MGKFVAERRKQQFLTLFREFGAYASFGVREGGAGGSPCDSCVKRLEGRLVKTGKGGKQACSIWRWPKRAGQLVLMFCRWCWWA